MGSSGISVVSFSILRIFCKDVTYVSKRAEDRSIISLFDSCFSWFGENNHLNTVQRAPRKPRTAPRDLLVHLERLELPEVSLLLSLQLLRRSELMVRSLGYCSIPEDGSNGLDGKDGLPGTTVILKIINGDCVKCPQGPPGSQTFYSSFSCQSENIRTETERDYLSLWNVCN